jgi:hypothetical protein
VVKPTEQVEDKKDEDVLFGRFVPTIYILGPVMILVAGVPNCSNSVVNLAGGRSLEWAKFLYSLEEN